MIRCTCLRRQDLVLHPFEDGTVVFDEADASLHAVEPWAGEALSLLMNGAELSAQELAQCLLGDEPSLEELAQVEACLQQFARLGFIACQPV